LPCPERCHGKLPVNLCDCPEFRILCCQICLIAVIMAANLYPGALAALVA
jgi:hypothetical protein